MIYIYIPFGDVAFSSWIPCFLAGLQGRRGRVFGWVFGKVFFPSPFGAEVCKHNTCDLGKITIFVA